MGEWHQILSRTKRALDCEERSFGLEWGLMANLSEHGKHSVSVKRGKLLE
jgi:hypothetical protein